MIICNICVKRTKYKFPMTSSYFVCCNSHYPSITFFSNLLRGRNKVEPETKQITHVTYMIRNGKLDLSQSTATKKNDKISKKSNKQRECTPIEEPANVIDINTRDKKGYLKKILPVIPEQDTYFRIQKDKQN